MLDDAMNSGDQRKSCMACVGALKITAQETAYQLQLEIKNVLESLTFVHSFHGFEVIRSSDKESNSYSMIAYVEQGESDITHLAEHALAHEAMLTNEVKLLEKEPYWQYFIPLKHSNGSLNLLLLECVNNGVKPDLKHVSLLVEIYQNCMSHIGLQNTDPLTGLENRKALSERLERTVKGERRSGDHNGSVLPSICMLDIDFFKRVNDEFGHLYGDEVLLLFSGLMKKVFRDNDFLYRYGGEEFVVLLQTSTLKESAVALERFCSAVEAYDFPQVGKITVSIGFVQMKAGELPSSTLDKADKALYYAKENGRNQVVSYHHLMANNLIEDEHILNIDSDIF